MDRPGVRVERGAQSALAHISHIGIGLGLEPSPAILALIDGDRLAEQKFTYLRSIVRGAGSERNTAPADRRLLAIDEARRFDLALERGCRQVRPRGCGSLIGHTVL